MTASTRRTSIEARLALAITALVTSIVVVEIALRYLAPMPYSSDLRWVRDGHVKARLDPLQVVINEHGNRVQVNSLGFRGPEPSPESSPGTLRLIVLGASSAFCYEATDDAHTWPALLEARLGRELGSSVEVINL